MKKLFILLVMLSFAVAVSAQKKEASFTLDATTLTDLYYDIGPIYGGCYTIGYQFDPLDIVGNGSDTIDLYYSLDGTDYYPLETNRYAFTSLTTAANTIIWDTLCYPYYKLSITNGLGTITSGYIVTTIYFIRID